MYYNFNRINTLYDKIIGYKVAVLFSLIDSNIVNMDQVFISIIQYKILLSFLILIGYVKHNM